MSFYFTRLVGLLSVGGIIALLVFLVPPWIPLSICIFATGLYRKWYQNPGWWLATLLAFCLVVLPLTLQWGVDYRVIELGGEIYSFYQAITPNIPFLPLIHVEFDTMQITYNLPPETIALTFTVAYFFIVLIRAFKQTKNAFFVVSGAVYAVASSLVFLGFLTFIVRGFTGMELFDILYGWMPWSIYFYYLVFDVLPIIAVALAVNLALARLGLG